MIYTSYYTNPALLQDGLIPIRISRGHPRFQLPYKIAGGIPRLYPEPKMQYLDHGEYKNLYVDILDEEGFENIITDINDITGGGDCVLLCFCKSGNFCHRFVFADWYKSKTGIAIAEL